MFEVDEDGKQLFNVGRPDTVEVTYNRLWARLINTERESTTPEE